MYAFYLCVLFAHVCLFTYVSFFLICAFYLDVLFSRVCFLPMCAFCPCVLFAHVCFLPMCAFFPMCAFHSVVGAIRLCKGKGVEVRLWIGGESGENTRTGTGIGRGVCHRNRVHIFRLR